MNILMISPGRLPIPSFRGGAVEGLIECLIEYNDRCLHHKIDLVTIDEEMMYRASIIPPDLYDDTEFLNVPVGKLFKMVTDKHLVPYRFLDYIYTKQAIRMVKRQKRKYDCIVIQNELVNGRIMKAAIPGRYIYHAHNETRCDEKDVSFLRECDMVITVSDFLNRCFSEAAEGIETVTVHNGINTDFFSLERCEEIRNQLREKYGIAEDETVVIFAGRLVTEKGIEELIRAFMMIPDEKKIRLLIAGGSFFENSGENAFTRKLKKLCEEKKERITFLGYVSGGKMPEYYAMADIGCVPSMWDEPFGLTVAEQMAMELPIVATRVGAIPEIVDETCGILVDRNENISKQIAQAILQLAENKEKRVQMGKRGRQIVCERFTVDRFCSEWFSAITRR